MQCANYSAVDAVNPLIKLVKQRQDLYFQLLAFVNKNIQSSSNDLDNLTIFNKFLAALNHKNAAFKIKQTALLHTFEDAFTQNRSSDDPKELLRFSSRIIEILEASSTKARKGVFDDNGKAMKEFNRFKIMLNKILKRQAFIIKDYAEYILNYCTNKFQKQVLKINRYVDRVEQGEDVSLRELYFKQSSDVEVSPNKNREDAKAEAKGEKKIDMTEHLSSTEQQEKKVVTVKKPTKLSTKRKQRMLNIRNKQKEHEQDELEQPPTKQQTANKLLKFYSLLELNKKDFLQDYIYDKLEEQRHKEQLLGKLLERNREINKQINNFIKKSSTYIPVHITPILPNKSSGDERHESASSKLSLRTSFVISKRKSSFHLESSDNEKKEKEGEMFQRTIRNIQPRRKSSHSNSRPQEKSKKLFVVKAPMVFEEEIIPQAQITQTQWLQAPLSTKCREKKNENIRLKRKNNPTPLENAFFPQNFRYPL